MKAGTKRHWVSESLFGVPFAHLESVTSDEERSGLSWCHSFSAQLQSTILQFLSPPLHRRWLGLWKPGIQIHSGSNQSLRSVSYCLLQALPSSWCICNEGTLWANETPPYGHQNSLDFRQGTLTSNCETTNTYFNKPTSPILLSLDCTRYTRQGKGKDTRFGTRWFPR